VRCRPSPNAMPWARACGWCLALVAWVLPTPVLAERERRSASAAVVALAEDLQAAAPDGLATAAVGVLTSLVKGLQDSGLLAHGSYDHARRRADFRLVGGGATGHVPPQLLIWFAFRINRRFRVKWETSRGGVVTLRFHGLKIWPLENAHDFYRRVGLDEVTCPRQDRSTRQEYYGCHLQKAKALEDLWHSNRAGFPRNLEHQFGMLADKELLMKVAQQLGNGFGWSMLLVLSAPPSEIEVLRFAPNGVSATTSLDWDSDGARLSARHHFKDLALDIARPLLGDTRFGGLVRAVGERWLRFATNLAVVLSVGEPRWRDRDLRGADFATIAELFALASTPSLGSCGSGGGCMTWHRSREGRTKTVASSGAAFGVWWPMLAPQQRLALTMPRDQRGDELAVPALAEPAGMVIGVMQAGTVKPTQLLWRPAASLVAALGTAAMVCRASRTSRVRFCRRSTS